MKDTIFNSKIHLNCQGNLHEFKTPIIMGIINTTPDSFYDSSQKQTEHAIKQAIINFTQHKVNIIDIGGYSSRPGAKEISEEEEIKRVLPAIQLIKSISPNTLISIDTFRAKVADIALKNGANIINDITGGKNNSEIYKIASKHSAPYILMHMRGTPKNMQNKTNYDNLIKDLILYFSQQIKIAKQNGVKDIIIDPGLGFSKTLEQNYSIIKQLKMLTILDCPILIGASRKSMLYKLLNTTANNALNATSIINTIALTNNASILRVHDVKEANELRVIWNKLNA